MASKTLTPIKPTHLKNPKKSPKFSPPSSIFSPQTPATQPPPFSKAIPPRRSSRRLSLNNAIDFIDTPEKCANILPPKTLDKSSKTPKPAKKSNLESAQIEIRSEKCLKTSKLAIKSDIESTQIEIRSEKCLKTPKTLKKSSFESARIEFSSEKCLKTPKLARDLDLGDAQIEIRLEKSPKNSKSAKKLNLENVQVENDLEKCPITRKSSRKSSLGNTQIEKRSSLDVVCPKSPALSEKRKRKRENEGGHPRVETRGRGRNVSKKRVYYKKAVYDEGAFAVGDDVYVKRREDASSDEEDPEVEECRVCFKVGKSLMIECDSCLGGFHLKCNKPPLKEVPEGDWICGYCEGKKSGKVVELPVPPKGKKRVRTLKEKLLSSDLWAARIESIWKEVDGTFWFRAHWYMIPEETAAGRQPHNLKRELYRTNDFADVEMESVIRHCYVMTPKEFSKAKNEGDDVFFCEYEYDIRWHSFKRLAEINDGDEDDKSSDDDDESDEDWKSTKYLESESEEDTDFEEEIEKRKSSGPSSHNVAANSRKGRIFGLQKIGTKSIPEHVRCHKQTELEKAKQTLLLATLPKSLPCRNKEMDEITQFIKGAICDDQCLGRCLYIHGVPGTGKTMSVLSVMRSLKSELDSGSIKPYCFVEINGLKLATAENIYRVIYEALSGHRVSWKKALHALNERFSEGKQVGKGENKPCILLIDELDLLVTRNQSVLYNILDWPTRPNSKLIVIGIANTMDLPEKLLPRISSRMGIHRLCFGPYNYQQLQEIIMSRLKGINAFDKQAVEFASRKVAAISGDARRALEICRRAAEIADYHVKSQVSPATTALSETRVGMAEVEAAIQEMFQAPHIQVIRSSCKLGKIFLAAMVHELYKTGMAETTFEKLAFTVSCFCTSNGEQFPGWDTLLRVGCKLGECRIIVCEPGFRHRLQKLQLNFPSDDITFALKDCQELPWLAKYL